jgi:hypothetical protein
MISTTPSQVLGQVLAPLIVGQGVWVGLTAVSGVDGLLTYAVIAIAVGLQLAATYQASRIRSTQREKVSGYVLAGRGAVAVTAGLFLFASLTLWGVLVFGRGSVSINILPHATFATVMSVLSVLNAWRIQPTAANRTMRARDT